MQLAFKSHRLAVGLFCVSCGLVSAFASCTDSYRSDLPSGSGHPSTSSGGDGGGGGIIINTDVCGGNSCSNDLKSVIDDCTGKTVATCTPDQGCYNGACINNPCDAANKAKSSYGCDYYAVKTQEPGVHGACFTAIVANTWSKAVHLKVDRDGTTFQPELFTYIPSGQGGNITYTPYDPMKGLDVGQVAILFLSRKTGPGLPACPQTPALNIETGVDGTGTGKAFHIVSDYPVAAYQIDPFNGATLQVASATLLIPSSAWDKDYLAISAYKASPLYAEGLPSMNILAYQDKTDVTITPVAAIAGGGGIPAGAAGMPLTYTLNKGEFLQITQQAELTGSPINASNPVGVFGAHACMTVPGMVEQCNAAQQQIAPAHALGNEYVAVRYKNRTNQDESPPWRIVGAADDTMLTWTPSAPPGAPLKIGVGEVVEFSSAGPFSVRSQNADHPFYMGGYMTGGVPFMNIGDPQWVNIVPPSQYLNYYVLFTDPTYPETSLVVVRTPSKADGKTFADVHLDCLPQPLDGWQKIGNYEYTHVDLVTGNFKNVGNCTNGRHEMTSDQPFGVTVWGWGTTQQTVLGSYAYPAGAAFRAINEVVIGTPK